MPSLRRRFAGRVRTGRPDRGFNKGNAPRDSGGFAIVEDTNRGVPGFQLKRDAIQALERLKYGTQRKSGNGR